MMIGQPASDPIIVRDQLHRTMMERGSVRLAAAIKLVRAGQLPPTPANDVMWLMPFDKAKRFVEFTVADPPRTSRDPCGRCGVREDYHAEGGCARYRRGRVA